MDDQLDLFRVDSTTSVPGVQSGDGGSTPTSAHHSAPLLRKADYIVENCPIAEGRALVEAYHYAKGGSNTRTYMHGLYRRDSGALVGVAWWIPPTKTAAHATYPADWQKVLSLSRLVIAPETPKNACSFLLAHSVRLIPSDRWPCLVTYADDWRGHGGTIYRASGWTYVGKTSAEATYTIRGKMTARKAGGHTRTHAEMLALGAVFEGRHAKHKYVLIRS